MMRAKSFQPHSERREQQNKAVLERKTDQNLYEGFSGLQVESVGCEGKHRVRHQDQHC